MQAIEKQLKSREENIESKIEQINKKEKQVAVQEDELKAKLDNIANKEKEIAKIIDIQTDKLQQISGLSRDDAKKLMMENVINDAKTESAHLTKRIIEEAKSNATKQAKSIILQAIQRSASDHSVESTVSVVSLDSDEMKGELLDAKVEIFALSKLLPN
jgi:ribonuclease Y